MNYELFFNFSLLYPEPGGKMNADPIHHSTALLFVWGGTGYLLMTRFDICLFSWDLGDFFQSAGGVVS